MGVTTEKRLKKKQEGMIEEINTHLKQLFVFHTFKWMPITAINSAIKVCVSTHTFPPSLPSWKCFPRSLHNLLNQVVMIDRLNLCYCASPIPIYLSPSLCIYPEIEWLYDWLNEWNVHLDSGSLKIYSKCFFSGVFAPVVLFYVTQNNKPPSLKRILICRCVLVMFFSFFPHMEGRFF